LDKGTACTISPIFISGEDSPDCEFALIGMIQMNKNRNIRHSNACRRHIISNFSFFIFHFINKFSCFGPDVIQRILIVMNDVLKPFAQGKVSGFIVRS